jgi:PAS domain S-box-containing protein
MNARSMAEMDAAPDDPADLFDQIPCGVLSTLPDGRILRANQAMASLTGRRCDELTAGRCFQDLLTIAGKLFYENQFAPLLRLQGSVAGVAFDVAHPDGRRRPVLVSSVQQVDAAGLPTLVVSAFIDATDRRAYEQELLLARRASEQLAEVVSASGDAIVSASPEGIVQAWNAGAERLFGFRAAAIIGRSLRVVVDPDGDDGAWRQVLAELAAGRPVRRELVARGSDGQAIDVLMRLTPHAGLLGEFVAISGIIQDISQQRSLERLQYEYLAMAAHELRSPLTGIKAHAQLMTRRAAYDPRSVGVIIDQVDKLNRLVDDLMLTSQVEADRLDLQLEKLDVAAVARTAVDQLGQAAAIEAPAHPLIVLADRRRLAQVLTNLLTNAVKYSPEGSPICLRLFGDGDEARIAVEDNGAGIPADALPHVFDRFFRAAGTSATAGTGLGLAISQRIIRAHGGRIEAASQLGVGSVFTVVLPLLQASSAPEA